MISRVIIALLLLQFVEAHQTLEDLDEGVEDPDDPSEAVETKSTDKVVSEEDDGISAIKSEMPEGGSMTMSEKFKWMLSQPKEYYMEHHKIELTGLLIFVVALAQWYRGKGQNEMIVMATRNTIRPIEK